MTGYHVVLQARLGWAGEIEAAIGILHVHSTFTGISLDADTAVLESSIFLCTVEYLKCL